MKHLCSGAFDSPRRSWKAQKEKRLLGGADVEPLLKAAQALN